MQEIEKKDEIFAGAYFAVLTKNSYGLKLISVKISVIDIKTG